MIEDLSPIPTFLDVASGEVLPANVNNAAAVLESARDLKQRINMVVAETTAWLVEEARHKGTKTFASERGKVTLTGGAQTDYDPEHLSDMLREAGCPEARISEAVVPEVSYRVNRSVLRQLVGANEDYAAAAALAERKIEKPYRASVRP